MHIDENLLEQYLLDPQGLSFPQRQQIEDHLAQCDSCRDIYDFLQSYYEEFRATDPPKLPWLRPFSDDTPSSDNR